MTFGERLKECRKAKGLSQKELAAEVGLTQNMIHYYESEQRDPRLINVSCIATVLGVSIDYLAGLSDEK